MSPFSVWLKARSAVGLEYRAVVATTATKPSRIHPQMSASAKRAFPLIGKVVSLIPQWMTFFE
jgi:hypothetical protein